MTETATLSPYGVSPEPAAVQMVRYLPGPADRVWAYLTDSDLRAQWLARGPMDLRLGGKVSLTWRNDDLSDQKEPRPDGFSEEHTMVGEITAIDPPRRLAFTWGDGSEVSFDLTPEGDAVKLVIFHQRLPTRGHMLGVSAGWHAHLDILEPKMRGQTVPPFWSNWQRLRAEYETRMPAS